MKKFVLCASTTIFWLCSAGIQAQIFSKERAFLSFGSGIGSMEGIQYESKRIEPGYSKRVNGPFYLKFEYALTENIGAGINAAYREMDIHFYRTYDGQSYSEQAGYTSYSILARINWHFFKRKKLDPYFGLAGGYRHLVRRYRSEVLSGIYLQDYALNLPYIPIGMEATLGARFMFTKNIGAYMEMGLAKTILQGGLTVSF